MQFTDNFSVIRGKHNMRAGFQISRQAYFQVTNFNGNPSFTFDGRYSGLQTTVGTGLADFLLGVPASAGGAVGDGQQDMRSTFYGFYIQDDWRVLPNFTINIGIRYEFAALAEGDQQPQPVVRHRNCRRWSWRDRACGPKSWIPTTTTGRRASASTGIRSSPRTS